MENSECRLLTLVGLGGVGKTRLALQAATDVMRAFPNGVYFVSLSGVRTVDLLVPSIGSAIGITFFGQADLKVQLYNYLKEKKILLVLDNFEHLLQSVELLTEILINAPEVKILVTSRERLHLQAEWLFDLAGLPFPSQEQPEKSNVVETNEFEKALEKYSAIQLFLQTVQRVRREFSFSDERPYVSRICQLVEGMPLGIEMAAAWTRTLPCEEIAQRIEEHLDFLATSTRDVPERHRNMFAVFNYSWAFLSDEERDVFMKLSVFWGGFRREAAAQIAGASLSLLSALVDKSLLQVTPSGRYILHELLRQFAVEKLHALPEEQEKAKDYHCHYYLTFLQKREKNLDGANLEQIIAEVDNVHNAWYWALEHSKRTEIRNAMRCLSRFYEIQGRFQEGVELFGRLVILEESGDLSAIEDREILGMALARQGVFFYQLGRLDKAQDHLQKSLTILRLTGTVEEVAYTLNQLGFLANRQGRFSEARKFCNESLRIYEQAGDQQSMTLSLDGLGIAAYLAGEYLEAQELFERSLKIRTHVDTSSGIAICYNNLGNVAQALGDIAKAQQAFEKCLMINRENGHKNGIATSLVNLGGIAYELGNLTEAEQAYQECLKIYTEIGSGPGMALSLCNLGLSLYYLGDYPEGEDLCGKGLKIYREIGDQKGVAFSLGILGSIAEADKRHVAAEQMFQSGLAISREIGDRAGEAVSLSNLGRIAYEYGRLIEARQFFQESYTICEEISYQQALGLPLIGLGRTACALGGYLEARQYFHQALRLTTRLSTILDILIEIAVLYMKLEEVEYAVTLLALPLSHQASPKFTQDKAQSHLADIEAQIPAEIFAAALEKGQERDLDSMVNEVLTR